MDGSSVKALAGAVALAAAHGGSGATAAVAIGISIALNEVGVDVDASIRDADQGVTTTSGAVSIVGDLARPAALHARPAPARRSSTRQQPTPTPTAVR